MKTCTYCGRENDDALAACRECGTVFSGVEPVSPTAILAQCGRRQLAMASKKYTVLLVALSLAAPGAFLLCGFTFFWSRPFADMCSTVGFILFGLLLALSIAFLCLGEHRGVYGLAMCIATFIVMLILPGYLKAKEVRMQAAVPKHSMVRFSIHG